jgi:hypothetical protein
MLGALTPGLSWALFGGWLLSVVVVGLFFAGAKRGRR